MYSSKFTIPTLLLSFWMHTSILTQRKKAYKKYLSGSEYQLPIWPTFDHRTTRKILLNTLPIFSWDKCINIFGSIKQLHGPKRYPQRLLPSRDPESLPRQLKAKKKKQPACPRQAESQVKPLGHKMGQTRRQQLSLEQKVSITYESGFGKEWTM